MRALMLTCGLSMALILPSMTSLAAGGMTAPKPETTSELFERATVAMDEGRHMGALALLSRVVFETPDDADAWNYIGFNQRKLGRYSLALEAYNKALKLDPKHMPALEYLGELYIQTNQMDKAHEQLQRLQEVCGSTECEEYLELKQAIAAHEGGN